MLSVDLDELAEIDRRYRLLSIDRPNLFSLRDRDFLPLTEGMHQATEPISREGYGYGPADRPTLKERVVRYLACHGIAADRSVRVELVTLPRMFGYRFNPVSFYYVRRQDESLLAAIVEVTNTFHEMKPFLLGEEMLGKRGFSHRVAKEFYVSPFSDVDIEFDFRLRPAADRLNVAIDDYEGDRRNLATAITGRGRPLADATLGACVFKYPLLTLRVIGLIHWHALRLRLKRVPWFAKKHRADRQCNLYRPHASLARPPKPRSPWARAH